MTASTTLANEGLFKLTQRPPLTRAVSLSCLILVWQPLHLTTTWFLCSFCEWQQDGLCQQRAPSQLKKPFVGKGRRGSHEQGNGQDLIRVMLQSWQLTLERESDHTWCSAGHIQWNWWHDEQPNVNKCCCICGAIVNFIRVSSFSNEGIHQWAKQTNLRTHESLRWDSCQ